MSVSKSKREQSEAEFLHVARELRLHTIRKCVGFPKRYTFYVSQQLADCATRVRDEAKMANSIYPTNRHEAQLRIDHLLEARAAVQALVSHVEEANELFGIDKEKMKFWMALADRETALLSGVIKKSRADARKLP